MDQWVGSEERERGWGGVGWGRFWRERTDRRRAKGDDAAVAGERVRERWFACFTIHANEYLFETDFQAVYLLFIVFFIFSGAMSAGEATSFLLPQYGNDLKCSDSLGGRGGGNVTLGEEFWDSLMNDSGLDPTSHQSLSEVIDLTRDHSGQTQHCEEPAVIDKDCLPSSPSPSNVATAPLSSGDVSTSSSVAPAKLLPDRPIDESCQALIAQMVEVCNCKPAIATQFLRATNWNLERSVALCFERGADVASSTFHQAVSFADTIFSEFADAKTQIPQFTELDLVARDTVVTWAAEFSRVSARLAQAGRDTRARVFFHWTSARTLSSIAEHGLLTKSGREKASVKTVCHGSVFGDGLYLANHPQDFRGRYGEVCLVCVCVLGKHERVWGHNSASAIRSIRTGQSSTSLGTTPLSDTEVVVDTIIGNKGTPNSAVPDEVVLHSPGQCIPIFSVGRSSFEATNGKNLEEFLVRDFATWLCNVVHNCFDHTTTKPSDGEYQATVPRRPIFSRRRRLRRSAPRALQSPLLSTLGVVGTSSQGTPAPPNGIQAPAGLRCGPSVPSTIAGALSLFGSGTGQSTSRDQLTALAFGTPASSGSSNSSSSGCSCNQLGSAPTSLGLPIDDWSWNVSSDVSAGGLSANLAQSGPPTSGSGASRRPSTAPGAHDFWAYNPKCAAKDELTLESARRASSPRGPGSNPRASACRKRKVSDAGSAVKSCVANEACQEASSRKASRK